MTDNEEKDLLKDVLYALFGQQLRGKYVVTLKANMFIEDAKTSEEARRKALACITEHPEHLKITCTKIDDILDK